MIYLQSQRVLHLSEIIMRKLLFGLIAMALYSACVKPKIYRAEVITREKCEARESILVKELLDRKAETMRLTDITGNLNRTIGQQETELNTLKIELTARTQQMGESAGKLATEKSAVEQDLANKNKLLAECNAARQKVTDALNKRKKTLNDLKAALTKSFEKTGGAEITLNGESLVLVLQDKVLFDQAGIIPGLNGKTLLSPLATFLADRPDLDVDIICYTDNVLPKDKTIKDTWDWSLQRATNIVRMLIQDFNVNANQLTPVGRGEFYPVTSNETPEGRQKNRRTEVAFKPVLTAVPE
jgi:chemotaxis protein MotB